MNPPDLDRFVAAQDADGTYDQALSELRAGNKRSHWMWFVLPQLVGLGHSDLARRYAIADVAHARAYLAHPVLGARLRECTQALVDLPASDPVAVLGQVDAMKLRSCMTLFELAAPEEPGFAVVLDRYFGGIRDAATSAELDPTG